MPWWFCRHSVECILEGLFLLLCRIGGCPTSNRDREPILAPLAWEVPTFFPFRQSRLWLHLMSQNEAKLVSLRKSARCGLKCSILEREIIRKKNGMLARCGFRLLKKDHIYMSLHWPFSWSLGSLSQATLFKGYNLQPEQRLSIF